MIIVNDSFWRMLYENSCLISIEAEEDSTQIRRDLDCVKMGKTDKWVLHYLAVPEVVDEVNLCLIRNRFVNLLGIHDTARVVETQK